MTRRQSAGSFAGPLATVRYTSAPCDLGEHGSCASGPDRRRGMLPCSCPCHDDAYRTALAYCSTHCHLGDDPAHPDHRHELCPGPRGELYAKVPGRRDDVTVPCTCPCHQET